MVILRAASFKGRYFHCFLHQVAKLPFVDFFRHPGWQLDHNLLEQLPPGTHDLRDSHGSDCWMMTWKIHQTEIQLMEKFLHHLGCPKRSWCWYKAKIWGILSGAGFFPSTVSMPWAFLWDWKKFFLNQVMATELSWSATPGNKKGKICWSAFIIRPLAVINIIPGHSFCSSLKSECISKDSGWFPSR